MRIEYVHASQVFDDDNQGYMYGINYIDDNDEIIDCEWFKTELERDRESTNTGFEIIE